MVYKIPVSIKGIIFDNSKIWLRFNERNEWELPGGKIDIGEQPEETLIREIYEELGFEIIPNKIISAYLYKTNVVDESSGVMVIVYLCKLLKKNGKFELYAEAGPAKFETFEINEINELNMPYFYKQAIFNSII
jgi:8-oxo-dGTP pyrophosphatase MutT (NUDIX family)